MCYLRCLRWRASGKKLGETVGAISGADRLSVLCSVHTGAGAPMTVGSFWIGSAGPAGREPIGNRLARVENATSHFRMKRPLPVSAVIDERLGGDAETGCCLGLVDITELREKLPVRGQNLFGVCHDIHWDLRKRSSKGTPINCKK